MPRKMIGRKRTVLQYLYEHNGLLTAAAIAKFGKPIINELIKREMIDQFGERLYVTAAAVEEMHR